MCERCGMNVVYPDQDDEAIERVLSDIDRLSSRSVKKLNKMGMILYVLDLYSDIVDSSTDERLFSIRDSGQT